MDATLAVLRARWSFDDAAWRWRLITPGADGSLEVIASVDGRFDYLRFDHARHVRSEVGQRLIDNAGKENHSA